MKIHLDTDLGGDVDDACALAMLLGWPDVEIVGVTTVLDHGGRRAGMVRELMRLAGSHGAPIAAGAQVSLTTLQRFDPSDDDLMNWGRPIEAEPTAPAGALELLARSIAKGARIIAIGPLTNLAMLEVNQAGSLARAEVTIMGGWVDPPAPGLPAWGPDMDWNIQCDAHAALIVAKAAASLTLATLPATMKAHLRAAHLPRLRASGPLGELLARQLDAYSARLGAAKLAREHAALPADFLNFQYDPVACAIAAGWPGATFEENRLRPVMEGPALRFLKDPEGQPMRVLVDLDAGAFEDLWLDRVEDAQRR